MAGWSPAARRARRHLRVVGAGDREQAVWELLVYPGRRELSLRDVVVLLDQYPVVDPWWRLEGTGDAYLRLADQLVPGGLVALNALHPPEHYLMLWRGIAPVLGEALGVALTPIRTDAQGVEEAANGLLILGGLGLLSFLWEPGR